MSNIVICSCGHEKAKHAHNGTEYCLEYIYGDFEFKCSCRYYEPYMELTTDTEIRELTDSEEVISEELPETI